MAQRSDTSLFERDHVRPKAGRTLICGSFVTPGKTDRRELYEDAIGVDMRPGPGVDLVMDLEDADAWTRLGTFAHIECRSVLEHSRRPWLLAANLERMRAGTLHVEVPFVWWPHAYPDDYFRVTLSGLRALFPAVQWAALAYETSGGLTTNDKIPRTTVGGWRYFARTMACGFA